MIRKPRRVRPFDEPLEFLHVFPIQRIGGTEVHRHAVLDNAILLQNLVEDVKRSSCIDHEIFRDDLKPIDRRLLRQDMLVVGDAKANANAVVGEVIEAIRRHYDEKLI